MSDRLATTQPLTISFSDGELASSAKLTALARQSKTGATIFEAAIGDLWNQSNDTILSNYPLHIPNISRIIGDTSYLNPAIYPTGYEFTWLDWTGALSWHFTEEGEVGNYMFTYATYPVLGNSEDSNYSIETIVSEGYFDTRVTTVGEVVSESTYFFDGKTGRLCASTDSDIEYSKLAVGYPIDFTNWVIGLDALPSIIPDARQEYFTGCRISKVGSVFYLHLPPRQPIVFDRDLDRPRKYPKDVELKTYDRSSNSWSVIDFDPITREPVVVTPTLFALNKATTLDEGNLLFWQSETVNAMAHEHYRYRLPQEISTVFGSLSPGTILPDGFMYLWNKNTNTIIDDVVFRKPTNGAITSSWILEVSSESFNFDTVDTADESEASYSSSDLILVTPGASISQQIYQLYRLMFNHSHDRTKQDFSADLFAGALYLNEVGHPLYGETVNPEV